MYLLRTPRPSHEKQDLEDIASLLHAEDAGHPGADPFEMLGGLDDPDKDDFAGCDGAVGVTCDQVSNVWDLVSDAHPTGEHEDCAVGVEWTDRAIGSFDEGCKGNFAVDAVFLSFFVQLVGHAGAAAENG